MIKTQPLEEVYDEIFVPTLTKIEEARHSEQMTGRSAEEVLQGVEELAEELESDARTGLEPGSRPMKRVVCVPARDFADEVACQLAMQVISYLASVQVISADASTPELFQSLESFHSDAVCVIGVPPARDATSADAMPPNPSARSVCPRRCVRPNQGRRPSEPARSYCDGRCAPRSALDAASETVFNFSPASSGCSS